MIAMKRPMKFEIRALQSCDRAAWLAMRAALWPEASPADHEHDVERVLASDGEWGFIAETAAGEPLAFAEVTIRKFANGCESQPVPFLEGIWVDRRYRREGVGKALITHIECFLRARGFHEWGSDALIENTQSHAAHAAWGFVETERVVCFRKVF